MARTSRSQNLAWVLYKRASDELSWDLSAGGATVEFSVQTSLETALGGGVILRVDDANFRDS